MSADRLSELQNQLDSFVFMCFTCVGVLQRDAPPSPLDSQIKDRQNNNVNTASTPSPNTAIDPNTADSNGIIYDDDYVFSKEVNTKRESINNQAKDMATQVARIVKSINTLIDALPGIDSTYNQQINILQELEEKNHQQGQELREKIKETEIWLEKVREAITIITEDKFDEENSTKSSDHSVHLSFPSIKKELSS